MNTLRIDKLQCRKYKLFWICWGAIAVWMIACIVMTLTESTWTDVYQMIDAIGIGIIFYVIPNLLASLGSFSQKKEMLALWKTIKLKRNRFVVNKINRTFLPITFVLFFFYCCIVLFSHDSLRGTNTEPISERIFFRFIVYTTIMAFAVMVYYSFLYYISLFHFVFKFIYFTTIKLSGRIRRIGIDLILMLLALFSLILFSAWLANTFVIISISSFLYDVYKIADFERQQEQVI